jgi:methylmalonyl-CoA/ethylmalonyl-CoA epimerase
MHVKLGHLRQIALPYTDTARSLSFYRDQLELEFLARYDPPGLLFFRLGETRLLLDRARSLDHVRLLEQARTSGASASVLYFAVADIHAAHAALAERGVRFDSPPHLIHRDDAGTLGPRGGQEWMAFFRDPDGNALALSSRIPLAR